MLTEKYDPLKGKMLQILDKNGKVNPKLEPSIDEDVLTSAYKTMVLARLADEKAVRLQRQGRLGAYPPSKGQEASQLGPAMALGKEDWLVWAFRELAALMWKGVPLWKLYLSWMGNEEGSNYPEGVRATPSVIPVASQIPHAVGISYASKLRGEKAVTLVFFGDGATSEGDFSEGLNFAGVFKTPTVFVCQNNQYAISLPRRMQTASKTIAQKAIAYGLPGIQVDGNDLLAMYAAANEAAERARKGEGATLIESYTYRLGDHTTSDDATKYRLEEEVREWSEKDPLKRFKIYLEKKGLWNGEMEKSYLEEAKRIVEEEVMRAQSFAPPSIEEAFKFNFASLPPELKEQMEFIRKEMGMKGEG
ncbi:MAG: pyruvate dehydrogenase (acetyl-transferring) E1 component subunit alpha [Euryarchaeota archaeon]|nr:pyruvate dehydrogenase (acetyl-transferring) E1 component subunit alpha [Euryarchaeota archaeon]